MNSKAGIRAAVAPSESSDTLPLEAALSARKTRPRDVDDLGAARGIAFSAFLGTLCWATLILLLFGKHFF